MRSLPYSLTILTLAYAFSAQAQQPGAIITGSVNTVDGKPAEFVNITLQGTPKGTTVDAKGRYRFGNIAPGTYTLLSCLLQISPVDRLDQKGSLDHT